MDSGKGSEGALGDNWSQGGEGVSQASMACGTSHSLKPAPKVWELASFVTWIRGGLWHRDQEMRLEAGTKPQRLKLEQAAVVSHGVTGSDQKEMSL